MTRKIKISVVFSLSLCCLSMTSIVGQEAVFQAKQPSSRYVLVSLFQGEEIALPEDFVARLDGGNLKLALKSFGLSQKLRDRDVLVSLIQEDGTRVEQRPDANGELTFRNVKEGLAALVVAGRQSTYAAMAFFATPAVNDGRITSTFEVPVATVDSNMVRSSVATTGDAPMGKSLKLLSEFPDIMVVNRFQVYLQVDGYLKGRVVVPEAGFEKSAGRVSLSFFRNGVLSGKATSSPDGTFLVAGLATGVHSVLASGPFGHAAFAFEVMPPKLEEIPPVLTSLNENGSRLVATKVQPAVAVPADELVILIIPPRLMPGVRDAVDSAYSAAPFEMAGSPPFYSLGLGALAGGGGMASGGGAGAGSAAGGAGALVGLAGLAIGVAAISKNDDSFNPIVATQITP